MALGIGLDGESPTWSNPLASTKARWSLAVACVLGAFGLRYAIDGLLPPGFPYLTFFPAVIATAFWCGRGPALAAAIASGLLAWYFFIAPQGSFGLSPGALVALGFYVFVVAVDIILIDFLRRAQQAYRHRVAQLRTIMDTVPVGILLAELPSGRIVEGSSFVEKMLRHPVIRSSDIHSYDEWVSYHPDGSRVSGYEYPLARMVRENADAPEIEVHYERGDGTRAWTRIMGRPVRDSSGQLIGGVVAMVDVDAEREAQARAEQAAGDLRALADNIPLLCWMADASGHVYWFNKRWYDYTGADPDGQLGWGWESVHDPKVLPLVVERWSASLRTGEPFEMTFPLRRADGVFRPFLTRVVPIREPGGEITRWFGANIDVTEQEKHRELQRLLINELNHRVKNTLATVQTIAAQLVRSGKDRGTAFRDFEMRLLALSDAQNLLTQAAWEKVAVQDLVERATSPFAEPGSGRVEAKGPLVWLRPESALGLSLALHELATNATNYGALSNEAGRVLVTWTFEPDTGQFELEWTETGGPAVVAPESKGFGTRLISRGLSGEQAGAVEFQYEAAGLKCRLTAILTSPAPPRSDLDLATDRSGETIA